MRIAKKLWNLFAPTILYYEFALCWSLWLQVLYASYGWEPSLWHLVPGCIVGLGLVFWAIVKTSVKAVPCG